MWNRFKTLDPWLFVAPILLLVASVVVIYSLTAYSPSSASYTRQALYAVAGLAVMLVATFLDYRGLKGWSPWLYLAGLLALLAVRAVGQSSFGAQRWINIGSFQFQPSELEKVVVIVAVASLLSRPVLKLSLGRFLLCLAAVLLPTAAVLLQPDLGTAIVIVLSGLGMLLYGKTTHSQNLALAAGFLALLLVFSLSFHGVRPFSGLLKGYQKDRLASFIDPKRDEAGSGYNILQSVIAVGSGGITGKGLGQGSQSQLNFLPVAHADFIFAATAETWGLVGAWAVIGLYALLILRIVQAARIAKDDFGTLICIGVAIKLLVEVTVNIGMNIRLMPVTGIPLPFLSYGGTTLLANALAVGLVQSVVIRYKRLTF